MFAIKHYPEQIKGKELDDYLANGWYRMGQTIFTTHFLCFGEAFYSAIWVRLDLEKHEFSKSLRKIIKRNNERFQFHFGKAVIDISRENLYQRYRVTFPGMIAPSIIDSLQDGEHFNVYNTYEFTVYDGDKLIAVSYFDLGRNSIASILGFYDPDYKAYSLGLYTMLMEVEYGKIQQFKYFYPGYVVPGYDRFEYKLRIGEVDYYDLRSGDWLPHAELSREEIPIYRMRVKLEILRQAALKARLNLPFKFYPLFEANLFGYPSLPFFDYPLMVYGGETAEEDGHYILVFDPRTGQYQLLLCSNFDYSLFYFNDAYTSVFNSERHFAQLILMEQVLESSPSADVVVEALLYEQVKGKVK
ncbi:MAG TPA: arginine-tRNA-protein transferase [Haliscomenobacter sp.]|uniref:arginine-tRNA-protein transferase n=1 Tax=Haliscomenobacter sp. TaxID=2717303 RepID=UPI002BC8FCB8|nr:arginine-tRNA-protein transferase [Haliscomenobacter sp.]HOY19348.1 arginine-tRNA-protein transferase [Haliscomenobacter sp.]HPH19020.1 arginine-tRNA-protein transferase [Haliscomenobacter sp.]